MPPAKTLLTDPPAATPSAAQAGPVTDAVAPIDAAAGNRAASEAGRMPPPPAQRPEYVPEKFWKDGKIDLENAFKSYGELETRFNTKTEDLLKQLDTERRKGLPEAPDKYEIAAIEGAPWTPDELSGHPAIDFWRKTAFEAGLPPEKFNEGVQQIIGIMTAGPSEEHMAAEKAALGENADQRINAVASWAKSRLGVDTPEFEQVRAIATSAAGIVALEKLMGAAAPAGQDQPAAASPDLTIEQLKAMQADKRYFSAAHRDPAFVKKVDEGFAKLYGQQKK